MKMSKQEKEVQDILKLIANRLEISVKGIAIDTKAVYSTDRKQLIRNVASALGIGLSERVVETL